MWWITLAFAEPGLEYLTTAGDQTTIRRVFDGDVAVVAEVPGCPSPIERATLAGRHALLCAGGAVALVEGGASRIFRLPGADDGAHLTFLADGAVQVAVTERRTEDTWDGVVYRIAGEPVETRRIPGVETDPFWHEPLVEIPAGGWRSTWRMPGAELPEGARRRLDTFDDGSPEGWYGWRDRGAQAAWPYGLGLHHEVLTPIVVKVRGKWTPLEGPTWTALGSLWIEGAERYLLISDQGEDPWLFNAVDGSLVIRVERATLARLVTR
jgi:hypothetical protein